MTSRFLELARSVVPEDLASGVADLLTKQVADERRRCVEICRSRAELWRRTPSARAAFAREEARARANEATYLADLIESDCRIAAQDGEPAN
ncbi:MAG TPA: hypothetical protein VLV78_21305 [Thermoanaerobaculia bacterium]|nr:hypothetical protein [Thermoanaerobaculia bacterium]